jgi:ABC-type methionine transport system ATPase subunit
VLKGSTDDVIKAICNAALNVEQGDIHLSPAQRQLFGKHRKQIAKLTSRVADVKTKRNVIQSQKGGFPFIPILIGTALGALGGKLFGG